MDLIHKIRTIAWYNAVADEAGAKSAYEVAKVVDELRSEMTENVGTESKSFAGYATGKVMPSKGTVQMVEDVLPWTSPVFDIGPKVMGGNAPLWLALGGSEQWVRSVLVWYDKELGIKQASGAPIYDLIQHVLGRMIPEQYVLESLGTDLAKPGTHVLAIAYRKNSLVMNLELMTAIIALWRLTMIHNKHFPYMNFFMTGLYDKAMVDLVVEPYGIGVLMLDYCKRMEEHHWKVLARLERGNFHDGDPVSHEDA